ncbi:MAG: tetratricopeptide repeat protein [Halobacteriota archaeon]
MKTKELTHKLIANLSILLVIFSFCFLSVGLANAALGSPSLQVSAYVTPSEIEQGSSGELKVIVSEVGGGDWAKNVTVTPSITGGCTISPSSKSTSRIGESSSTDFYFIIHVPTDASLDERIVDISVRYYHTGLGDIGTYGPDYASGSTSFHIKKKPLIVYPSSGTSSSSSFTIVYILLLAFAIILVIVGISRKSKGGSKSQKTAEDWFDLGLKEKNPSKKLIYYTKCLELNPKNAHAWYNKGFALFNLEKYEGAIWCVDKALEINPTYEDALKLKSRIEEKLKSSTSELVTIERAIYDPCKRDFIERALPRMKEWINRYDPGAYWFAMSIQNNTDRAIEEWGVELETSSALKVEKAIIEGMEYKIGLHETHPEPYKNVYAIGVPKEYGIVIPKGGAQRVYFKLRTEKPKTTYEISGVFKSAISGDVPIRTKEFKYLCDTGVSPEAVKAELKKTFSEKDAARLANTFRVVQEIRSSYCNTGTTAREINKEFDLLKMYFTEKEFLDEIGGIQRRINAELREDERLDEKHVKEVKGFCEKFTEMWIARFLR